MVNDLALHSMAFYIDPILLVTLLKCLYYRLTLNLQAVIITQMRKTKLVEKTIGDTFLGKSVLRLEI